MSNFEVPEPIINSAFEEPQAHWYIQEGEPPEKRAGRRPAMYFYRDPRRKSGGGPGEDRGTAITLLLVNRIRQQVKTWREQGYPGVTRTTLELLQWWQRDGREKRLFFAQLEAAMTVIFLVEARADLRQGITIPRDEPSDEKKEDGFAGFLRYACKMATGSGKTTVMAMLAAWSILNKVNDRSDGRFSDVALVVCPNVTIRRRLGELDPEQGEASIYRTRDLVPEHLMPLLRQGRVLVTNWHVFEPHGTQTGGESARVVRAGREVRVRELIHIGSKTTTARGSRYLTLDAFQRQVAAGLLNVIEEEHDRSGTLIKVRVESLRYVESDTALVNRVLGREVGGKQNILVMNDEAHHAYRIRREEPEEEEAELFGEEEEAEEYFKEATVWIDGLDRIQKLRGINLCVDLSATPYFLGRVGQETNRPFPWVVSDFGLVDAIESGLTKIPQLAVRDTTGAAIPGYFNIWKWILEDKLTPAERGGKRAQVKPEAILKYAHHPIAMLGGLWEETRQEWRPHPNPLPEGEGTDGNPLPGGEGTTDRTPVFILVCKTTQLAKVIFQWLAEGICPAGIPPSKLEGFRNVSGTLRVPGEGGTRSVPDTLNTIRVDTKVVHETDTGEAKSDESRWMRVTLDTVGKRQWPCDRQGRPIYPEGFAELAKKLDRPLHPPGRDVRCIVSVGMLTEGWDCNTVTHIIGLRPFMSQLLCEQVIGRGLRRASYEVGDDGRFREEVAKVFGVPFEIVPFKANQGGAPPEPVKRRHVHAIPGKAEFEIQFPRVEGYTQAIRNRVSVDFAALASLVVDPLQIPPEVDVKAALPNNQGRPTLCGPGKLENVTLNPYRSGRRLQELAFDLAAALTRDYARQPTCTVPAQALFPQVLQIVERYLAEKVKPASPAEKVDVFLSPYYGWVIERLSEAIRPDTSCGEAPEVPRYETSRGPGSTADIDFTTSRDVREVVHCHLNYVVADTRKWEQSAAYYIDHHRAVAAFVKNSGLGFAIPYLHNGQMHDYVPDFLVRLKVSGTLRVPSQIGTRSVPDTLHLILETKGWDPLEQVKRTAAERWVAAVNADGGHGRWYYRVVKNPAEINGVLDQLV